MKRVLTFLFAAVLLLSAYGHFFNPAFYSPMIPSFIPESMANIGSGLAELIIGIGLLIPKYRGKAALGFTILMIAFLPIHIWDLFKENPAVGPMPAPVIRLVIQFVVIYAGYWLWKKYEN